jgi:hypothetical protein
MRGGIHVDDPRLIHNLPTLLPQIDQQQSSTTNKLSNEQWQALITMHRILLHEGHDSFQ